ncbi:PREDICTED: pentatricopeptide repeat-containing protein At4g14050, mitochondrial-like [Erythranthe guttata]|uniref:pentatricopeptide repeat-containing protein At4g14050, mitochondrial-like n=1 Tax=Erythranthe guttata TaxID=4155 RepID=UPI00064E0877|nr:PREDICTED: pentatricopeptide repeat-containing protein At4g14050, mitochondrial-like [Erythranthe guttata]|eukprot:XP_012838024.1 PREDICTED: pentatricopeptide repeat-containing protein At4g14050, mitochondrial-like [Erythranthe guttata]
MYGKCSHMKDAVKLFDEMSGRDLASWASIFTAHNQANLPWQTHFLFSHMRSRESLQPDHFIFACLVKACTCLSASKLGLQLHAQFVLSRFSDEDVVKSSLVDFYAKCGLPDQARKVFHSIVSKNVVSWTSLVYGYARIERKNKALEHLDDMPLKNVHSWTTPISCFVQGGHCTDSFKLFNELRREDIDIEEPFVLSSLIVGSSSLAMLELGKQVLKLVIVLGYESSSYISNALIDMYDKCSDVLSAEKIFGSLRRRDVVSWTFTIVGLAQHGREIEALSLCTDGS